MKSVKYSTDLGPILRRGGDMPMVLIGMKEGVKVSCFWRQKWGSAQWEVITEQIHQKYVQGNSEFKRIKLRWPR